MVYTLLEPSTIDPTILGGQPHQIKGTCHVVFSEFLRSHFSGKIVIGQHLYRERPGLLSVDNDGQFAVSKPTFRTA